MPCKKCKDGKYKWGNTGECKYATKEECEKANPKKYKKMKQEPSPLGNKTYEEYAKELKEYRLSKNPELTKVELGIVDDVEKLLKQLKSSQKDFTKSFDKSNAIGKEIKDIIKKISPLQRELEITAKDLGIKLNDIPAFKRSEEALDNYYSKLDKKVSSVTQF